MKRLLATILTRWASRLMDTHIRNLANGKRNTNYAVFIYHLGYAVLYAARCVLWGKDAVR